MTKIAWTESTWNPVVGCTKVSPGCKNCYAERMALRLAYMGQRKYKKVIYHPDMLLTDKAGKWNGEIYCDESVLDKPLHWKKPRKIFVCSMGDLFHESVPFDFIDKVIHVFEVCKQHTGQILTKRHERLLEYDKHRNHKWPDNIIGMVSCENQKYADLRIPYLLQCGFKTRGVSLEPLLGPIQLNKIHPLDGQHWMRSVEGRYRGLDWVIIGAESNGAWPGRECKIQWIDSIVKQCKTAKVPCFVKQIHWQMTPNNKMLLLKDPEVIISMNYPQQYPGETK